MIHTELLNPETAGQWVQNGSDIAVIPYASTKDEIDGDVRLTIYSRMTALAAAELYDDAGTDDTKVVAVGEHTFGTRNPSTTQLMNAFMVDHGVPAAALPEKHPWRANATPQQIAWLSHWFGEVENRRLPILVGHAQHWKRIEHLCHVYRLPAGFLDAQEYLDYADKLTPEYAQAVRLYNAHNRQYEDRVMRLTQAVTWLGPTVTTYAFRIFTGVRTPNVVDIVRPRGQAKFQAMPVRKYNRELRLAA